jgi:hypothetical protein
MSTIPELNDDEARSGSHRRRHEDRIATVRWVAGLGAVTAEALAHREQITLASARGRLQAALAAGLLASARPLRDCPALYTVTSTGMKAAGCSLAACNVSPGNARHLAACAAVAAAMARCYPEHAVSGERELRREEAEHGRRLASANLRAGHSGEPLLHRPDLVLWPAARESARLPLAVEVELTVKAQRRLEAICRAWARCDLVAGVLYLAAPQVERPLHRAIGRAQAKSRVIAVPLSAIPGSAWRAIPSAA